MNSRHIILVLLLSVEFSHCARILGVFPTPSYSHQVVFQSLMTELAKRGHEVVAVTTDPNPEPVANLTEIDVKEVSYGIFRKTFSSHRNTWDNLRGFYFRAMFEVAKKQFQHPQVRALVKGDFGNFDVCFFEAMMPNMFAFRDIYNCTTISFTSLVGGYSDHRIAGNPLNPSLYETFSSTTVGCKTFWDRLNDWYLAIRYHISVYLIYYPKFDELNKQLFGSGVRSMFEIVKDVEMVFINAHRAFGDMRPVTSNTVYLGGLHIKKPKRLPTDIEIVLDNAKNGVVYFSFGTNVNTTLVPEDLTDTFLNVFRRLPFTVIWKYDTNYLDKQPPNVHFFKWLPQQDVLAHRNVKLFITQGGQQSTEEAIDREVPMLVIPFLGDQHLNAAKVKHHKIGDKISFAETITEDKIEKLVTELMTNKVYKSNIASLKARLYDNPLTSLERAVFWTEYVIRNNGAKHLRTESFNYPFYVTYCLDVIAVFIFTTIVTIAIFSFIVRYILLRVCNWSIKLKKS